MQRLTSILLLHTQIKMIERTGCARQQNIFCPFFPSLLMIDSFFFFFKFMLSFNFFRSVVFFNLYHHYYYPDHFSFVSSFEIILDQFLI